MISKEQRRTDRRTTQRRAIQEERRDAVADRLRLADWIDMMVKPQGLHVDRTTAGNWHVKRTEIA